ncbi:MAG TPA: hypothetical protein VJN43_23670 [Bryobacteraceae bacterium]|nr:hypothetical protein [Bryobacteraceae bacterium]
MEWSVHIAGAADLGDAFHLESFARLESGGRVPRFASRLNELFGNINFTRCAFGTEFCENLLPEPQALAAAVQRARGCALAFTLLTPYVSDRGIARLKELFPLLAEGDEVVFNDWGVLNVLRREFTWLVPVQGRLLNKSLRDPRVMGVYGETSAPNSSLVVLQRSNLDCASYTDLLARLGVAAVEMDHLPQGTDLSFADRGVRVSVYLPFGFISTSRVCMAAGLHYRKREKFQPGAPCRHECQTHLVEYTYTDSPFGNRDQKFLLKGNTYFYAHSDGMLRQLADKAQSGRIARAVYQPRLPMMAAEAEAA